jgi:hypothetical protein
VGLLSCFLAFLSSYERFYVFEHLFGPLVFDVLPPLFGLLGAYLLWPLTALVVAYMFFMTGWPIGLLGLTVWVFCIWRLWKAKKWRVYFDTGALLTLTTMVLVFIIALTSNSGGRSSPEASFIISDLRSMKVGALMYKSERNDDLSNLSESENHAALLAPYVDNPSKYTNPGTAYNFRVINGVGWVGYSLDRDKKIREVYEKLAGKAASVGLLKSPALDVPPASDDVTHRYTKDAKVVWMRAF